MLSLPLQWQDRGSCGIRRANSSKRFASIVRVSFGVCLWSFRLLPVGEF